MHFSTHFYTLYFFEKCAHFIFRVNMRNNYGFITSASGLHWTTLLTISNHNGFGNIYR